MVTFARGGRIAIAVMSLWMVLIACAQSQPPSNHDRELGAPGFITGMHVAGYSDPLNENCGLCHGAELKGGYAVSCFVCHGALWDTAQPQYPDSHSLEIRGNRAHTPREADCAYCHDVFGDLFKKTSFWHAQGHGTPYGSGCAMPWHPSRRKNWYRRLVLLVS